MATVWEMVNCGKCPPCTAGIKSHGPKPYHRAWVGGRRLHLYGPDGGSFAGSSREPGSSSVVVGDFEELPEAEKKRMRREARREYRELLESLTPEERARLDEVVERQKEYDRVARREKREYERRVRRSEEDLLASREGGSSSGDSSGEPGLTAQALSKIAEEVAEQFAAEKKELKKQLEREKKEWKKMLAANRPKKSKG